MSNYILTTDGELYHYGVKGQRWGVRRYQNKDGTLTKAGKRRLAKVTRTRDVKAREYDRLAKRGMVDFEHDKDYIRLLKKDSPYGEMMRKITGYDNDNDTEAVFGYGMKELWKQEIEEANHTANLSRDRAEAYIKAHDALMKMDLTSATKKDVIRKGRDVIVSTWAEQSDRGDIRYDT